jgi:hypothetical protein
MRTVDGEGDLPGGYKVGVGGSPIIVVIERDVIHGARLDDGYYESSGDRAGYWPSEIRFAFKIRRRIPPRYLSFEEENIRDRCDTLIEQVESLMIRRPTFGYAIKIDWKRRRVLLT